MRQDHQRRIGKTGDARQALAQRGLAHFRRWAVLEVAHDATRGIADITEGLRLHTPGKERKHQLLVVRAQLLGATGQLRRASDDYRLVLSEDPGNEAARAGLAKNRHAREQLIAPRGGTSITFVNARVNTR